MWTFGFVCGGDANAPLAPPPPPGYGPALLSQKKKVLISTRNSFHRKPPGEAYFRELDFAAFCIKHITLLFSNGL